MMRRAKQLGVGFVLAAVIVCAGGCSWFPRLELASHEQPAEVTDSLVAPGTLEGETSAGENESAQIASSDSIALAVQFDVLRVDLPVERVRHSLKIWNHLDESLGDPVQTALLARNGFRIGVGERSVWSAIRTIFEENGARSTRATYTVQDGRELMIPLGDVNEGDTYFVHGRGGQLKGGAFDAGTKFLAVDCAPRADDPTILSMTVTPRTRDHKGRMKYVEHGGQIMSVQDQEGLVFSELAAPVSLAPGQFLVIGGSAEAESGYLLGSWWLNTTLDAQAYEIVLCVSAKTVRVR